ncbi:RNase H domain-containing protein [Trichonephila clavipes]|nr:RNase H domain-containing protein [Trichonephila clavipes]
MLVRVYEDQALSMKCVYDWLARFREGRESVSDNPCRGSLAISVRDENVEKIHFQWIPSHVNIAGNEIADSLVRAGAGETTTPAAPLTTLKLFSKYKAKNKAIWMIPPVHSWYQSKYLGGYLVRDSSRRDQTALTHISLVVI